MKSYGAMGSAIDLVLKINREKTRYSHECRCLEQINKKEAEAANQQK